MTNKTDLLKEKFGDRIEVITKSPRRVYVTVAAKEDTYEVIRFLFKELGARFSIASAIDTRSGIEVLYHLALDQDGVMISVRALAEKPEPSIRSLTDFLPGANWIEREMHEMMGVDFPGHPKLERFLLPDDWPAGVYPQRKKTFESTQENEVREK